MADSSNIDKSHEGESLDVYDPNIATNELRSGTESVKTSKSQRMSSSADRQVKFERAQKALENAALVSKRIKEHRKATAELLGKPFEDDDVGDSAEMASTISERTNYSIATDTSTTLSVQDALNIPGISESLANTLKQKELLMERIKQYKEISKRPMKSSSMKRESVMEAKQDIKKTMASNTETTQLLNSLKEKENALTAMQVKIKAMETTILDLQEKINEKDQIIEAKNMATTLMSDSLSKKEKDSLLLLEDTRQQMTKMQENFITMETDWREEKQRLLKELEIKEEKIKHLEEANTILENSRFDITVSHSKLLTEIELKNKEITQLQANIESLTQNTLQLENAATTTKDKEDFEEEEEKGSIEISKMVELTKKIELLEQINCQIRQTNIELENKLANINIEPKSAVSPSKKASPLPPRKGGRNTASKLKSPWSNIAPESSQQESEKKNTKNEISRLELLVQSLNKDILDKEYIISQKDTVISELQSTNAAIQITIAELQTHRKDTAKVADMSTDTVDIGCTRNPSLPSNDTSLNVVELVVEKENQNIATDLVEKLSAAQQQILSLNEEIDIANKNMVKVKSNHKLKLKQMQKTIDNFSKISDANAEIVKLNEELHQLSQKVAELEEEKGNLQLHLVDYDSGRLTESDIYKKMIEMENLAETRLKAISVLEAQKFELVQDLHILQQKNVEMEDKLADMSHMHNEQVCSEMKSVQLEEQIDELTASRKELELIIENLKLDKEQLNGTIKLLQEEKEEMLQKLESYIQENMELTDKFEKLSAEKVSSAESIEIVDSLTTQEKLELEEYNKGIVENKVEPTLDAFKDDVSNSNETSVECFIDQIAELNKKIELFVQEREEVMEKMNKLNLENEKLNKDIVQVNDECELLQNNIDILSNDKQELQALNEMLNRQIEDLKRERVEIVKETAEIAKPLSIEENIETAADIQQDDKNNGEKGVNRIKSVKQLTKEILKLKNTIKEREEEIADCQMKILSLEEQHQKQNDLIQTNAFYENKLKALCDENESLKNNIEQLKDKGSDEAILQLKHANELMQEELNKTRQEYANVVSALEARVHELENVLLEYEKQIFNYGNSLQQKDKEIVEYVNQITKLNDVSQKLKSTIELLEEEKAKDQNAEMIKSLNKQIAAYLKKLSEYEDKLKILEDEKVQLLSVKVALENKNISIESELTKLQESFIEKQNVIKELQTLQKQHTEEVSNIKLQAKERDEEIHEIKLQLRKESIENEKLRSILSEKDNIIADYSQNSEGSKQELNDLLIEKKQLTEQFTAIETKNKELMEKLKKFAATIKKKSSLYIELESQLHEAQRQLETKNEQLEQLIIQVETLPPLQDKLKHAEEEINRIHTQKLANEQLKVQEIQILRQDIMTLEQKVLTSAEEVSQLRDAINVAHKELHFSKEENVNLKGHIEILNKKLVEHEVEQKTNLNFITKISALENDIGQKQAQIEDLLQKLENQEQLLNQLQFGHNAKVQERDMFIESLETEITKYKNRICRLEESISVMEDRRHTLERKADQLDSQLQEKHKAYSEYSSQEDELVNRLAALIDHDRVVEKQLHEIEAENRQLQDKLQHMTEENHRLRKSISDVQEHYNNLLDKANRTEFAESELSKCQSQLHDLEVQHKRITHDHQTILLKKKQDIEDLESEFNTQIENAIKEKKVLSEKYEKINEHVTQLGNKLQEYIAENERLKINMEDLNRVNQDLLEKSASDQQLITPDYTEQYINEINKLNSVINGKNEEISELNGKLYNLQVNGVATVTDLQNKISDLTTRLHQSTDDVDQLVKEIESLKESNDQLQHLMIDKDDQIKELKEKKKVTFEMNIPKTEGMVISSTIEALNFEEPTKCNIPDLESQIILQEPLNEPHIKQSHSKESVSQALNAVTGEPAIVIEEVVVPKKAYLCYKGEEQNVFEEIDPFNSDEGWGLGDSEEVAGVVPGLSLLNEQINKLQKDNESLKTDLNTTNTKLLKVMKKFKDLKANNDILTNELKLSKQLSQSSFLDNAIEDELRSNIQELEKRLEELNTDLTKEKREKDAVKKQNEVICNANDKLTEIKEKLDNEVELWKYKFKEVNDKLSTLQWTAENKDSPDHKVGKKYSEDVLRKDEVLELEKENDELQLMVDQLTTQNNELITQQANWKCEINNLKQELLVQGNCQNCEKLNITISELQNKNEELLTNLNSLNVKLKELEARCNEVHERYENLKLEYNDLLTQHKDDRNQLTEQIQELESKLEIRNQSENEAKLKIDYLISEMDNMKQKIILQEENSVTAEKESHELLTNRVSELENHTLELKQQLDDSSKKITELLSINQESEHKLKLSEEKIVELNSKIENLNSENDQLLSNVAELRSSISSAVDQRGYEIAEIWKQHLAQRETDFLKLEQELRTELSAAEAKYEQLLDSVQSSSQEETNKLIMLEQVNSLQNKIQDKEEHLRNLQDKYAEVVSQLDVLRSEQEDEKVLYENKLLVQQDEYEKIVRELNQKNQEFTDSYEENINTIQQNLATVTAENDELRKNVDDLKKNIEHLEGSLLDINNQLRLKESEIYQKSHEYAISLSQRNEEFENVRKHLLEYEKRIEDLNYEKESELAVLRLKMHEKVESHEKIKSELIAEKSSLEEALNDKIIECTNLNKQLVDLNKSLEEHGSKAVEMQTALENQELEIVTLKDEIFSLQQAMKKASTKIEKHVTFASDTKSFNDGENVEGLVNKELLDAVPRAELDLALYMLHQRDVRCEELTMELTQLLEERDTLQLRLSDSLRSNEELKSKFKVAELDISTDSHETISELPSFSIEKESPFVDTHRAQSSRSSSISEYDPDKPKLQAKLSELRSVKHSRDVRFRQESEQRQMDLRLLQRDVANLPPEAVDQLAQAHHTLSRDSQSTSTVLLNWLRGKSTPKVVHM